MLGVLQAYRRAARPPEKGELRQSLPDDRPEHSVKPKSTWQMLKPHFEELVTSYVFPQLSFTPDRQEQWNTDPVEYIRNVIGAPQSGFNISAFF